MSPAIFLTLVASLLVRHPAPVHCKLPAGRTWPPRVEGTTYFTTGEIYLRRCRRTRQLEREPVKVFAHELIHLEHPRWPHWKVYRWDDWYGRVVVGPAIRRAALRRSRNPGQVRRVPASDRTSAAARLGERPQGLDGRPQGLAVGSRSSL